MAKCWGVKVAPRQACTWSLIGHSRGVLGKLLPFSESQFPRLHCEGSHSIEEVSGEAGEVHRGSCSSLGAVGLPCSLVACLT